MCLSWRCEGLCNYTQVVMEDVYEKEREREREREKERQAIVVM